MLLDRAALVLIRSVEPRVEMDVVRWYVVVPSDTIAVGWRRERYGVR
jgi:hypothetical protein